MSSNHTPELPSADGEAIPFRRLVSMAAGIVESDCANLSQVPAPHGTFTCSSCKLTFPKGWSDEEARAEYEATFGAAPRGDVVCDDCYKAFMGGVERGPMMRSADPAEFRSQGLLHIGAEPSEFGIDLFEGLSPETIAAVIAESAQMMSVGIDALLNGGQASNSGEGWFMMNVHQALNSFLKSKPLSAGEAKALAKAEHLERVRHRNEVLAKFPIHHRNIRRGRWAR